MKLLKLLSLSIFFSLKAFSQCEVPSDISWHFEDDTNLEILFTGSEGVLNYEIVLNGLYDDSSAGGSVLSSLETTGAANEGPNIVQINTTEAVAPLGFAPRYYYEVLMRLECLDGWTSQYQFYVSPYSLRNNPDFICDLPFTTIQYLADGAGFTYNVDFLVPPDTGQAQQIVDLGILVDVGHTYNGDLSISLTSPSGTEVDLLTFPNGMGGSTGMSLYFSDDLEGDLSLDGTQGFINSSEPLSSLAGEPSIGVWTLTITDNLGLDNGFVFGGCLNLNSAPCISFASGSTFYDFNENEVQDANEVSFPYAALEEESSQNLFFSNQNGSWGRCLGEGSTSISMINIPDYFLPVPVSHDLNLSEGDEITGLNFALQADGVHNDLTATILSTFPDRPGFSNDYSVIYSNEGNTCLDGIAMEIELDERLTIDSISAENFTVVDNTISVVLGSLCPPLGGSFKIFHTLDDTVAIGSVLESVYSILPIVDDSSPENNSDTYESTVVGAYDPNDKFVDHEEITPQFINENKTLDYRIRFQNTGNFYAERVVITDLIDENLDLSTLEVLSYSHDMEVSTVGNMVYFTFEEIFLPDSTTNEPESHGYVWFRIKPQDNLVLGDIIENTAYIYFDFNEPIITNTIQTTVVDALSISDQDAIEAKLYPNPASDQVQIVLPAFAGLERISIFDLRGKEVSSQIVNNPEGPVSLQVSELSPGIYFLRYWGKVPIKSGSFVKQN